MSVRIKVVCNTKQTYGGDNWTSTNLVFSPVYTGSEENKQFFAATPGGTCQFYTVNPTATAQFEIGKEYYIDFTPAV